MTPPMREVRFRHKCTRPHALHSHAGKPWRSNSRPMALHPAVTYAFAVSNFAIPLGGPHSRRRSMIWRNNIWSSAACKFFRKPCEPGCRNAKWGSTTCIMMRRAVVGNTGSSVMRRTQPGQACLCKFGYQRKRRPCPSLGHWWATQKHSCQQKQ